MTPATRRAALREWRGLPSVVPAKDRTAQVGDLLAKLLPKLGLEEKLDEQQVLEAWEEVVGHFLATHSKPVGLSAGTLLVQVLQPSVHYELDRVWKPKVLTRLQERFGRSKIRAIRFRL